MELLNNLQGKEFGPIGVCIYCGSDGGVEGLRDEHIIPFSLGGKSLLLKASCRACEAITSYLDGYLARSTFWELRVATNTQTRGKYPALMPVRVSLADKQKDISLPAQDFPFFTHLPVWGAPGLLYGSQPTDKFGEAKAHMFWYVPPDFRKKLGIPSEEELSVLDTSKMPNLKTFARAIAKIAYCNAVAVLGWKSFRPLCIPDLILGYYTQIPHFVGAPLVDPPQPLEKGKMHEVKFEIHTMGNLRLIVCNLRIFAHSGTEKNGMPIYSVIVGAPALKGD